MDYKYNEDNKQIWQLLHQARRMLHRCRQKELLPLGITSPQSAVLSILDAVGKQGTIPSDIARQLFREPHTIIGILNVMEKNGLVKTAKDLERKNMVRVTLTPKGREIYLKSIDTEFIPYIMSDFSEEDRRIFKKYLKTLRDKSAEWLRKEQKNPWTD
jgi:DNA-binding MarR family transcriptional regulator